MGVTCHDSASMATARAMARLPSVGHPVLLLLLVVVLLLFTAARAWVPPPAAPVATRARALSSSAPTAGNGGGPRTAEFGGGCFWCLEAVFQLLDGVQTVKSGFAVPQSSPPVEVVRMTYDPSRLSYDTLLELFWSIHDPTQGNRQNLDVGAEYRSAIVAHGEEQCSLARASIAEQQDQRERDKWLPLLPTPKVTTQLLVADECEFRPAGRVHDSFYERNKFLPCK